MSGEEWETCQEPMALLNALPEKVSERKAKVFRFSCRSILWRGLLRDRTPSEASDEMLARLVHLAAAGGDEAIRGMLSDRPQADSPFWETCPGLGVWLRWLISGTRYGPEVAQVIRELWPNPFAPQPFHSQWRTSAVVGLAKHICYDQNFDAMPILADALQDAGCDNQQLLDHCRRSAPHLPGCWAVDLVLRLD